MKTAIVTGANTGIGLETARGLADTGATTILACRNVEKAQTAADDIRGSSGNEQVNVVPLDLASLSSIRGFVEQVQRDHPQVDILVNNAGVVPRTKTLTQEGFEAQIGVNHLGHFLLTNLLQPMLDASSDGRVVVVSSTMHKFGKLDFDSFTGQAPYQFMRAYAQSKLANVLFAVEAARRWQDNNISVNAVHPGPIRTEIYRDIPQPLRAVVTAPLLTPKQGAKTSLHVALSTQGKQLSGTYFARSKPAKTGRRARDPESAQRLWDISAQLTGL